MDQSEESVEKLVERAKDFEDQAKETPENVVSDLPQLVSFVQRGGFSRQEVILRDAALESIYALAEYEPNALTEQYPELIEAILDTQDSRSLAKALLHESAALVDRGVSSDTVVDGIYLGTNEAVKEVRELADSLDAENQVPGGGATAMHLHNHLEEFSDSIGGREQLAVDALTAAFEKLVEHSAKQRNVDPVDAIVDMRSVYETASKPVTKGLSSDGRIEDVIELDETDSSVYAQRYIIDGCLGAAIIVRVEQTEPRILRTEAVLSDRIH